MVTDLGDLPGGTNWSQATSLNEYGQVVGYSKVDGGNDHAFLWTPNVPNGTTGTMIDLGDLPGGQNSSQAMGINNLGQITGVSSSQDGRRAFVWTPQVPNGTVGTMTALGTLPGTSPTSSGAAINDAGQVVGSSYCGAYPDQHYRPFLAHASGGELTNLGTLSDIHDSHAYAINSSGQIVGLCGSMATLWMPNTPNGFEGQLIPLGDLPGGSESSTAVAINDRGQVAGSGHTSGGWRGAVWTPHEPNGTTGSWVSIGDLPGGEAHSNALDINNLGQVVGVSKAADGDRAVFWSITEGLLDLNTLLDASGEGWILTKAFAINDRGQIVGYGMFDPDGAGPLPAVGRGFLLTPVPEPSTIGFLAVGLILLGIRRRR
jgi:probable HAF family extracellular repeat protein